MKEIKAFVGHSFTESDDQVVRKFTDYFDSVALSHPQFSWESAENAEPRILTEKVLRLIEDKNTFIGICTQKEQVAPSSLLRPLRFQPSAWKIGKNDLKWKTSDWIVQEIGLAIGKRLNVILLVEDGVRDPGGLQGDIEYISFDRATPEKSFGKILEMLSAISPRAPNQIPTVSDTKPVEPAAEATVADRPQSALAKPDDTWTREKYEMAAFRAVFSDNEAHLAELTASYRATTDGGQNAAGWDAFVEYARFTAGKGGKLQRLKELAEENPNPTTLYYLGLAYASFDQHNLGAETFAKGAGLANDVKRKAKSLRFAIEQYSLGGQAKKARETLKSLRALAFENPLAEQHLLQALLEQAEREKDQAAELAVLERMIELQPDDMNLRFSLAYKYGRQSRNDLSLYHYLMIPADERSPIAWNNLGATLNDLELSTKGVDAYKRAADAGETLAMSNLGNKLLQAGFLEEALAQYRKASALEKPHKNVGQLFTTLESVPEQEDERQKALINDAKKRVVFMQRLGAAVGRPETASSGDRWQGLDCILTSSLEGGTIKLEGHFDRTNALAGGLLAAIGGSPVSEPNVKYRAVYSGKLQGQAVFGTINKARDGAALDLGVSTSNAYMFFSEDGNELYVMVDPDTNQPTYERLRKLKLIPKAANLERS